MNQTDVTAGCLLRRELRDHDELKNTISDYTSFSGYWNNGTIGCSGTLALESMYRKTGSRPLMMVARPRAVPIPLPRIALGPTRLNLDTLISKDRRGPKRLTGIHGGIL